MQTEYNAIWHLPISSEITTPEYTLRRCSGFSPADCGNIEIKLSGNLFETSPTWAETHRQISSAQLLPFGGGQQEQRNEEQTRNPLRISSPRTSAISDRHLMKGPGSSPPFHQAAHGSSRAEDDVLLRLGFPAILRPLSVVLVSAT
jgi:hypothetical protein